VFYTYTMVVLNMESIIRLKQLLSKMPSGYAYHEIIVDENNQPEDYRFIEVNESFEILTGLKKGEIIGKTVREIFPGIENDPADWIGRYGKVALQGDDAEFELFSEHLAKWYGVKVYSPEKGFFVTLFSETSRKHEQEKKLYYRSFS